MFSGVNRILQNYPKLYLACHTRHVRDDETGRTLTQNQARILDHLNNMDPLTVSDLARHLDVTESTISIQLDKLQRAGYVRRLPDQNDRRRMRVLLTPAGHRVKEGNSVLDPELVRKMIAYLRPGEAELALRGLELLGEAADQLLRQRPLKRGRTTK